MRKRPGRVENFTTAFFVTCGVTLFMALFTMAAMVGMVWVLLTAALIESLLRLREARLNAYVDGPNRRNQGH